MQQKIVFTGGPGTGKTAVLHELMKRNYYCMPEISREIIAKAKQQGIDQLFLTQPLRFSEKLLKAREQQFLYAEKTNRKIVFFDRGIPEIYAYMDYAKIAYPTVFIEKSNTYRYDKIYLFRPWKKIYTSDNERYETFEESVIIHQFLIEAYKESGYSIIEVPFGSVKDRTDFIINSLSI